MYFFSSSNGAFVRLRRRLFLSFRIKSAIRPQLTYVHTPLICLLLTCHTLCNHGASPASSTSSSSVGAPSCGDT